MTCEWMPRFQPNFHASLACEHFRQKRSQAAMVMSESANWPLFSVAFERE